MAVGLGGIWGRGGGGTKLRNYETTKVGKLYTMKLRNYEDPRKKESTELERWAPDVE